MFGPRVEWFLDKPSESLNRFEKKVFKPFVPNAFATCYCSYSWERLYEVKTGIQGQPVFT